MTITTTGLAVATGRSGGDARTVAYTSQGTRRWQHTLATPAADEGAAVTPLAGGEVEVAGYTRGRVSAPKGGAALGNGDVFLIRTS
ncbi:hypothetical protein [Nonomuraea helvata]|uniref:Uncharacterized protein n=1 Tax=Nonomuraea helvata TaxID=37484 RepID=A0ABV5SIZ9_9ACTN